MNYKSLGKLKNIIFPILLILYGLMLVNKGLTVTDTGYNYSNFVNFNSLDAMWKFSTYLALALGSVFTHLPFGATMLGLNIYTGLVKVLTAVLVYFFFVKAFGLKEELAFFSQLIALGFCWCPTALLYNYCTYLLFTLGGILLCLAVQYEKNILLFLAGILLGLNVMVRLPNLAEMALIFALWFCCFFKKTRFGEVVIKTLLCVAGYVAGIVSVLAYIFIKYGAGEYINGITEMLAVSEGQSSYSLKTMIRGDISSYIENFKWIILMLILVAAGTALYMLFRERFLWIKRIIYVCANILMIFVFRHMHMFGFIYYNYEGIYYVGIFFLLIAGLLGLYVMFFGGEDYDFRMRAMVAGIIILISPLGSNNYLFSAENNIFFVVPFVLECIYKIYISKDKLKLKVKKLVFDIEPLLITLIVCILFIAMQGILFGARFVFRDGIDGSRRVAKIENNDVLKGMYTNQENGDSLNELNAYLISNDLKRNKEVLLYYNVPALSFYMEMKPAINTTWPDLDSYSYDKFVQDIEGAYEKAKTNDRPVIIMGCEFVGDNPKLLLLQKFVEENEYTLDFSNGAFYVYR